jgi:hypothetical protein
MSRKSRGADEHVGQQAAVTGQRDKAQPSGEADHRAARKGEDQGDEDETGIRTTSQRRKRGRAATSWGPARAPTSKSSKPPKEFGSTEVPMARSAFSGFSSM